jgi:hypothetical protein
MRGFSGQPRTFCAPQHERSALGGSVCAFCAHRVVREASRLMRQIVTVDVRLWAPVACDCKRSPTALMRVIRFVESPFAGPLETESAAVTLPCRGRAHHPSDPTPARAAPAALSCHFGAAGCRDGDHNCGRPKACAVSATRNGCIWVDGRPRKCSNDDGGTSFKDAVVDPRLADNSTARRLGLVLGGGGAGVGVRELPLRR